MYEVVLFFHKKCPKNKPQNRRCRQKKKMMPKTIIKTQLWVKVKIVSWILY